jgi:hypothetical protein
MNGYSLTEEIPAGTELNIPAITDGKKKSIVNKLSKDKVQPASAILSSSDEANDGIGYWTIEDDFIVQ